MGQEGGEEGLLLVQLSLLAHYRLHLLGLGQAAGEQRGAVGEHLDLAAPQRTLRPVGHLPGGFEVAAAERRPELGAAAHRFDELGLAGLQLRDPRRGRGRLLRLALEEGDVEQVMVGGAEVRLDPHRLLELLLGLGIAAHQGQQLAHRVVRVGLVGSDVEVGAEQLLGGGELPLRHRQVPEVVLGPHPVGIGLDQAPVALLRRRPVAPVPELIALDGQHEGVLGPLREVGLEQALRLGVLLGLARPTVLDQQPLALGQPAGVDRGQRRIEALDVLLLAARREGQGLDRRHGEARIELGGAPVVRRGLLVVVLHLGVEPAAELGQRLGRRGRPLGAALAEHQEAGRGERGGDQQSGPESAHQLASRAGRPTASSVTSS